MGDSLSVNISIVDNSGLPVISVPFNISIEDVVLQQVLLIPMENHRQLFL